MDASVAGLVDSLRRGEPDLDRLGLVGDPEPVAAAAAFVAAAQDPDLQRWLERWVPALLHSARPGAGAQRLRRLAQICRNKGIHFAPETFPALASVLGSSEFLARWLLLHPERVKSLAGDPPPPPADQPLEADWDRIRDAKHEGLLRTAARDLCGRPFRESLRELSDLADRCLTAGLACAAAETGLASPALLTLGKLGGQELNFSSDVDLLFVYEPPSDSDPLAYNAEVGRLIRQFKKEMEARTPEGFGYRVDLDLRPEGPAGVLANSVDAALEYYETFGAEWERQMLIRLRPLPGDPVGSGFADQIQPFVYRRAIDPDVIHEIRDMKSRIEEQRRRTGKNLDYELKDGAGGIRDVEFLVQSIQLFAGGDEPSIRTGNVLAALEAIADRNLLPVPVVESLERSYLWLRRAEHALQMAEEQQTARFPADRAAQLGLARRMGYADPTADAAWNRLMEDWTEARTEVRGHFEALVLRAET